MNYFGKMSCTFAVIHVSFLSLMFCVITSEYKNAVNFSLGSNKLREVLDLKAHSFLVIQASDIPQEISSVLFQIHTQGVNLTLSQHETPSFHYSINGTNLGLTTELHGNETISRMWVYNYSNRNSTLLIILIPLNENDPVPGGCNMEFPVSTSPFIKLLYKEMSIVLEYEHANIGVPRDMKLPSCSHAINILNYHIYIFYLEENSYGEQKYFSAIENMSNITFINKYSKIVNTFEIHPLTRATFYAYPNVGVVYNVVARYRKNGVLKETAYVPTVSYGCHLFFEKQGCFNSGIPRPAFLILSVLAGLQVFFGHRFFNWEMVFFGFVASSFSGFILFVKFSTLNDTDIYILSALVGAIGGIVWMFLWNLLGRPVISLILVGFVLGFILSATAMNTPLGNLEIFNSDKNYWLALSCGTLLVTVVFLPFGVTLSIISSSIVGSFVSIVAFEQDRDGTFPYILINVIRRAISNELSIAYNEYPFKRKEIISSCSWVIISVIGMFVQFYTARSRASFPEPWKCFCCCRKVLKCTCSHISAATAERQRNYSDVNHVNEHQPLISTVVHSNIINYETIHPRS